MRILVVDDDRELAELVSTALSREDHQVSVATRLDEARELASETFSVIVLDVGLPDGSGLDLCRELRAAGDPTPILLLTAQSTVAHRVDGLDAGADDYLVKPFAIAELRARVRALGRRPASPPAVRHRSGDVDLDLSSRRAWRDGEEVALTAREWTILEALAKANGRAVGRSTLLETAWGTDASNAAASLEVLISRIRRKLGREVVRTVRGHGYAIT